MTDLDHLLKQATNEISNAEDLKSLDHYRVHYLGKKGILTESLKSLGQLSPEERPKMGQKVNVLKEQIQTLIADRETLLQQNQISEQLAKESIDVTLDG